MKAARLQALRSTLEAALAQIEAEQAELDAPPEAPVADLPETERFGLRCPKCGKPEDELTRMGALEGPPSWSCRCGTIFEEGVQ